MELALGLAALGVVLGCGAMLLSAPRGAFNSRWWWVILPLVAAGTVIGFGERVLTAGVIGANIGAGLVILLGGPAVVGLVLGAVVQALMIRRSEAAGAALARRHSPGNQDIIPR
ncbi:hypothetical protein [Streptacidiphilus pinicola]|nr:hypothetical protein [Streptacidiphilus pinicola]